MLNARLSPFEFSSEEKKSFNLDDFVPSDELILQHENEIRDEISAAQPLVASVASLEVLLEEYKNNPRFIRKIQVISATKNRPLLTHSKN